MCNQWNPLQWNPPRSWENFVKPTPVVTVCVRLERFERDFDGDSFDDIFCAHVLKIGRKTEEGIVRLIEWTNIMIDIYDNVLQILASMTAACRRGWVWLSGGSRLEWSEQLKILMITVNIYHLQVMLTLERTQQCLNNSCKTSSSWGIPPIAIVILDRNPKSTIGWLSKRRAVQSFMPVALDILIPTTNSLSWIECSGKVEGKIFLSAIVTDK